MDWSGSPEPASQLARWPQYHRSRFPPVITACVAKRGGQTPGIGAVPARATVHRVRHHCAHDPCDWTRAYFWDSCAAPFPLFLFVLGPPVFDVAYPGPFLTNIEAKALVCVCHFPPLRKSWSSLSPRPRHIQGIAPFASKRSTELCPIDRGSVPGGALNTQCYSARFVLEAKRAECS